MQNSNNVGDAGHGGCQGCPLSMGEAKMDPCPWQSLFTDPGSTCSCCTRCYSKAGGLLLSATCLQWVNIKKDRSLPQAVQRKKGRSFLMPFHTGNVQAHLFLQTWETRAQTASKVEKLVIGTGSQNEHCRRTCNLNENQVVELVLLTGTSPAKEYYTTLRKLPHTHTAEHWGGHE